MSPIQDTYRFCERLKSEFCALRIGWRIGLIVFLILFAATLIDGLFLVSGEKNLHVLQASSFLQGRLNIDIAGYDSSLYNGRIYVAFPPMPALLLVPMVAIFGIAKTKSMIVALVLTALNGRLLLRILAKLGI